MTRSRTARARARRRRRARLRNRESRAPSLGWRPDRNADRPGTPLGALLVERDLITSDQLEWALEEQRKTGSRLGSILVAGGLVRRLTLYRVLSEEWGIPFVDVTTEELDPELLARFEPGRLIREGWMPLREDDSGEILVATSERPTSLMSARIGRAIGQRWRPVVTTDWDILQGLLRGYGDEVTDEATSGLWRRRPAQSARQVLTQSQKIQIAVGLLGLAAFFSLAPDLALPVLAFLGTAGFLVSVLFKTVVSTIGARHEHYEGVSDVDVAALSDDELPVYTVLVPLYREANVIADLIENLSHLDYPSEKLEVLLLLEEDDHETIDAARRACPPENFVLMIVPDGLPKTKPKACNVGLFFASGDYLVIYDAEDRPDPDQLKKSYLMFQRGDEKLICVQAALNYWNDEENLLTRMFTLEYSFWFDYMLPGLDSLGLPIPLGGTSNHFRVDGLRELGGWDPFNVTEDADLGIRASALGYTVGVVNSTTFEEANRSARNWIRQRSRWIKGYLQTLLVHLREPRRLVRTTGVRQTLGFALLIGGTPLTFLVSPILLTAFLVPLFFDVGPVTDLFPPLLLWGSLFNLLVGNAAMIYLMMMGAFKRRRYRLVAYALLNPFYWLFHAVASYKAVWQLIVRPHYWEKTLHGLSTVPTVVGGATDTDDDTATPSAAEMAA